MDEAIHAPKSLPRLADCTRWTLDMFADGAPVDTQLPKPDLSKLTYPALLRSRACLDPALASDEGRSPSTHCAMPTLTAMPAGKVPHDHDPVDARTFLRSCICEP